MNIYHQLLFNQRQSFEQKRLQSKVEEIKQDVIRTKNEDPVEHKPTVQEILECVEAKQTKTAVELIKRYLETFKEKYYQYKFT